MVSQSDDSTCSYHVTNILDDFHVETGAEYGVSVRALNAYWDDVGSHLYGTVPTDDTGEIDYRAGVSTTGQSDELKALWLIWTIWTVGWEI